MLLTDTFIRFIHTFFVRRRQVTATLRMIVCPGMPLTLFVLILALASCTGPAPRKSGAVTPQTIISVVPNVTETLFAFELTYSGIFRVQNLPADQIHPVVMIECPRLLFPFARQIVAEAVTNLGFPPLLLDPIDFASAYIAQAQAAQEQGAPAEGGDNGGGEPTPSDA